MDIFKVNEKYTEIGEKVVRIVINNPINNMDKPLILSCHNVYSKEWKNAQSEYAKLNINNDKLDDNRDMMAFCMAKCTLNTVEGLVIDGKNIDIVDYDLLYKIYREIDFVYNKVLSGITNINFLLGSTQMS